MPKERFDVDTFYHPDGKHHGRTNAPYTYMLQEDLRAFDAPFFNIQAGEAESMDPQQRLLLEMVYEAVSNSGMRIQDLQGSSTAVYVGMMTHDYETVSTRDLESIPTYSATGVAASVASNRVSYFFDWHGPSMSVISFAPPATSEWKILMEVDDHRYSVQLVLSCCTSGGAATANWSEYNGRRCMGQLDIGPHDIRVGEQA
jgi:hypothetical protein